MKRIPIVAIALLLILPAMAQENVFTPNGGTRGLCSMDSLHWFAARSNGICYASDAAITFGIGEPVITAKRPDICKDRQPVFTMEGKLMCAADLSEPIPPR
jgi:hypothetical protein